MAPTLTPPLPLALSLALALALIVTLSPTAARLPALPVARGPKDRGPSPHVAPG